MGFIWASPTAVMVCAGGPKKNRRDCVNQNVRSLSIKKYAPNPHKILRHATARWIVLWDVGIHMNSVGSPLFMQLVSCGSRSLCSRRDGWQFGCHQIRQPCYMGNGAFLLWEKRREGGRRVPIKCRRSDQVTLLMWHLQILRITFSASFFLVPESTVQNVRPLI